MSFILFADAKMVAIYWFYMYLTHKSYKKHAGCGFTRYSYVALFTKVTGVLEISFQICTLHAIKSLYLKVCAA